MGQSPIYLSAFGLAFLGSGEATKRDVVVTLDSGKIYAHLAEAEQERAKSLELELSSRSASQEPKQESHGVGRG